jgi:hypothetical protein
VSPTTKKVKGVGATVRAGGYTWRATVRHLGGGGTDYARFNGSWLVTVYDHIPSGVYKKLRAELNRNVAIALGGDL